MKSFLSILVAGYYLFASVGISVNIHYCLGRLQSINLFDNQEDNCCIDEVEETAMCSVIDVKHTTCCDDEPFFYQLNTEQDTPQKIKFNTNAPMAYEVQSVELVKESFHLQKLNVEHLNLPPPTKVALWLLNCSPTYYG